MTEVSERMPVGCQARTLSSAQPPRDLQRQTTVGVRSRQEWSGTTPRPPSNTNSRDDRLSVQRRVHLPTAAFKLADQQHAATQRWRRAATPAQDSSSRTPIFRSLLSPGGGPLGLESVVKNVTRRALQLRPRSSSPTLAALAMDPA
jgi:hypothetical protein